MALRNPFKGKEQERNDRIAAKKRQSKEAAKPATEKKDEQSKENPAPKETVQPQRTVTVIAAKTLKKPHVTEKAVALADRGQYVFEVFDRASKGDVKRSVEQLYKVNVVGVNMITIPDKKIRVRRQEGIKQGYKKAIVTLQKGQKIEVLPT